MQKLRYRLRYWKRAIWLFFGFCHKCNTRLNYTTRGKPVCPWCGN